MKKNLESLISRNEFIKDDDDIFCGIESGGTGGQELEIQFREKIAEEKGIDYMNRISESHSIPVMDYEVDRFLNRMPTGAIILDIGGCWGWHWRHIAQVRPDLGVIIMDFVRANLLHAKQILGSLVGNQVLLFHADATNLPFLKGDDEKGFDGVWTVQVFQHIPNFKKACREAYRVLKERGLFVNYSLHRTPLNRLVYGLFRKKYILEGMWGESLYLNRASDEQKNIVEKIFGNVEDRYTECFFHPELKLGFSGKKNSLLGKLDVILGGKKMGAWIARQRSFEAAKSGK